MIAALILLIAASSMIYSGRRLKAHPVMLQGHIVRTPFSPLHLRMQVRAPSDDDIPGLLTLPSRTGFPTLWKARFSGSRVFQQTFPPTVVRGIDAMQVLYNWADSSIIYTDHKSTFKRWRDPSAGQVVLYMPNTFKKWQENKARVLQNMQAILQKHVVLHRSTVLQIFNAGELATASNSPQLDMPIVESIASSQLQMVGLIPKDVEASFLESGPSAADVSVLAVGVFSRGHIKDDSRGTLRNLIPSGSQDLGLGRGPWPIGLVQWHQRLKTQFGPRRWGRDIMRFGVFAIEGLADAPGLSENAARVLLSRIGRYAIKERKMVVVSHRACTGMDGKQLVDYYVRLGFAEVEMEDGRRELVYTKGWLLKKGPFSAEDVSEVDNDPIMVGMIWTGA